VSALERCGISYHLSPVPSTSTAVVTPEHTVKDPDDLEPADEGDIQM